MGHLAEGALPRRQRLEVAPAVLLDGLGQVRFAVLRTEELSMGLGSVEAVLRRRGDRGDHLPFLAGELAG